MKSTSSKGLFRAIKPKPAQGDPLFMDLPEQSKPLPVRDPLDYDPTPRSATRSFLHAELPRIREIGGPVWECAVGGGHIANEMEAHGLDVIGNDIVDRGWPGTDLRSFYDFDTAPADIIITNPPYNQINARDGHGRWLRKVMDLNVRYCAMLLNWDWIAARKNGMDELHAMFPPARAYVCCWKIDFTGNGSPPQRNAWIVWDREWTGETVLRRLFLNDTPPSQGALI